ncbi:unnamed protein product [Sphagnum balticum]
MLARANKSQVSLLSVRLHACTATQVIAQREQLVAIERRLQRIARIGEVAERVEQLDTYIGSGGTRPYEHARALRDTEALIATLAIQATSTTAAGDVQLLAEQIAFFLETVRSRLPQRTRSKSGRYLPSNDGKDEKKDVVNCYVAHNRTKLEVFECASIVLRHTLPHKKRVSNAELVLHQLNTFVNMLHAVVAAITVKHHANTTKPNELVDCSLLQLIGKHTGVAMLERCVKECIRPAVPDSLDDQTQFLRMIDAAKSFEDRLKVGTSVDKFNVSTALVSRRLANEADQSALLQITLRTQRRC